MRICLIGAPTVTEFEEKAEAESEEVREAVGEIQLGVISLAAVLESIRCPVTVVDLNSLYYKYLAMGDTGQDFCTYASRAICQRDADVYGFGSICSSYPLSIRIASEVKMLRPNATILFGGPQASVVDTETLATFPCIDLILRGEAERTMPLLVEEISGQRRYGRVPGLTYRAGGRILRNANAPVIDDLDSLPIPAYHLAGNLDELNVGSLELGRGCPFACKFCSTNDFFRRRFRVKTPRRMLDEMRFIAGEFGFRQFDLIHDMFTVDRKRVVAFCNELIGSGEVFKWACSARTDCIDEELLQLMADAGCTGIFFGIETGSAAMQKTIDKHLDIPKAKAMVDAAERVGIETTVSLITGFPEETNEDLRDTVRFYMHAVRTAHATPQLNLLAPLAATPIHSEHRDELVLDELCSDISHQGRYQNGVDRLLIETHRDIFPNFYLLPTPHLDRAYVLELREFLLMATGRIRWLLAALDLSSGDILKVFSEWRPHRLKLRPELTGGELRYYYRLHMFREDFLAFLRPRLMQLPGASVRALFAYEEAMQRAIAEERDLPALGGFEQSELPLEWSDRLQRRPRVYVFELEWDVERVVSALQKAEEPQELPGERMFYATRPISKESSRVVEIDPWGAFILRLSTGDLSVHEIVEEFARKHAADLPLPAHTICVSIIEALIQRGFIGCWRAAKCRAGKFVAETTHEYSPAVAAGC